jgi:hypothetical protein
LSVNFLFWRIFFDLFENPIVMIVKITFVKWSLPKYKWTVIQSINCYEWGYILIGMYLARTSPTADSTCCSYLVCGIVPNLPLTLQVKMPQDASGNTVRDTRGLSGYFLMRKSFFDHSIVHTCMWFLCCWSMRWKFCFSYFLMSRI